MAEQRGTITRRMDEVMTGLEDEFAAFYSKEDLRLALMKLRLAEQSKSSDRSSKRNALCRMLDACGITDETYQGKGENGEEWRYDRRGTAEYYGKLLEKAELPDSLEDAMLYALYTHFDVYPSPADYMKRLVERLSFPEDQAWEKDSVRLRLLKQLIKYSSAPNDRKNRWRNNLETGWSYGTKAIVDYCGAVKYKDSKGGKHPKITDKNEILSLLDEGIFQEYEEKKKALSKDEKKNYALIRAADDVAKGWFRTNEATKKILYLLAMVYDMTYYSGAPDEIIDYTKDLERNLFENYYANNMLRFQGYRDSWEAYENDPAERGINYKNFAEMICIYYISQDMEPWEKVERAGAMMDRMKGRKAPQKKKEATAKLTVYYRSLVEDILTMTEEELEDFLLEQCNCSVRSNMGPFQLETEQRTAFREYKKLLEKLEATLEKLNKNQKDEKKQMRLENCNYGLWFVDLAAEKKAELQSFPERWKKSEIDRERYERLLRLLLDVNKFVGRTVEDGEGQRGEEQERKEVSQQGIDALCLCSPEEMSRTSFLVAYYYFYNAKAEMEGFGDGERSFQKEFREFKQGADGYLEAAGYKKLSGRSLFDVLLAYSSYARRFA